MNIELNLQTKSGSQPLGFRVKRMINAGFTGRDRAAAQHHLDELAAEGVPVPSEIPVLYPVIRQTLLIDPGAIEVYSGQTAGEVEFVILLKEGRVYIGLGSDHTDRKLEETDIPRSKQICPNVMAAEVWPLEDLAEHWDKLVIRLTQTVDGREVLYQDGPVSLMMPPEAIMDLVVDRLSLGGIEDLEDYVIFSGTIGNLTGGFVYGDRVSAELIDSILDRRLRLDYAVERIDYLD